MTEAANEHVSAAKALLRMATDVPFTGDPNDELRFVYARASVHALLAIARAVSACASVLDEIQNDRAGRPDIWED